MSSAWGHARQGPGPPQPALARLKGSIKKKAEIPKHSLHVRYKSFLSLIPHVPRALPAPALRIKEERLERPSAALAPHPMGLCRSLPAKAGIHGPGYRMGKVQVSVGAQPGTFTAFGIVLKSCFAF